MIRARSTADLPQLSLLNARRLLAAGWTAKKVADTVGLRLGEVQELADAIGDAQILRRVPVYVAGDVPPDEVLLSLRTWERIRRLRQRKHWGPERIAAHLRLPVSIIRYACALQKRQNEQALVPDFLGQRPPRPEETRCPHCGTRLAVWPCIACRLQSYLATQGKRRRKGRRGEASDV